MVDSESHNQPPAIPGDGQSSSPDRRPEMTLWWVLGAVLGVLVCVVIVGRMVGVKRVRKPDVRPAEVVAQPAETPAEKVADAVAERPLPQDTGQLIEEIRQEIEQARKRFPEDLDVRELEARFLDWVGRSEEAVAIWQECLGRNPDYTHAYVGLASVAFKRGDHEQAVMWARQAIGLDPTYYRARDICAEALLNLGRAEEAIEVLESYLARDPRAHGLFLLGRGYSLLQQWDRARRAYEAAIKKYPNYAEAFYALSRVCIRMGDKAEGERLLARYWELMKQRDLSVEGMPLGTDFKEASVNGATLQSDLGRVYLARGDRAEALRLWHRAIAIDPGHLPAREMLAELALREGDLPLASRYYRELMELDSMSLQYPLALASILAQLGQFAEAEKLLDGFCQRWPERPEGYAALAQLYLGMLQRPKEAMRAAETLVSVRGTAGDYALLAQAAHQAGDRATAEKALQRAMELAPGRPEWEQLRAVLLRDPAPH